VSWPKFFRRRKQDADLQQEMDSYLTEEISENISRGLSPGEARRQAQIKFGSGVNVREGLWQQNSFQLLDTTIRNLKFAMRTFRRSPGFTTVSILIMALAIGSNIAMFTVVRGVLLNPLPYHAPEQLFALYEHEATHPDSNPYNVVAAGSIPLWQSAAQDLAELSTASPFQGYSVSAESGKLPERIEAGWCSYNLFSTLGVVPVAGRFFTESDDRPDAQATVVLAHSFWKRRYASDPSIVGKEIWLNSKPYTVVGVLPSDFFYSGKYGGSTIQVWTPLTHEASPQLLTAFDDHEFTVVARLRAGATFAGLISRLTTVQQHIKADHPGPAVHDAVGGRPLLDDIVDDYKTSLYTIFAATGCVLLIACLNVASLLVARTAARAKELAIRAALGGDRLQLLLERVTESFLLSLTGGAIGLFLAWTALRWLIHTRHDITRVETLHFDSTVALFAISAIFLCTIFSGLISALGANSRRITESLQDSSRSNTAGQSRAGLRKLLLVLEVSLTVVLLVGAGLLLKSFQRLRNTSLGLGVPAENVLAMYISIPEARYKTPVQQTAFFEQLINGVRTIPGVDSAGLVSSAPGRGWGGDRLLSVAEHPPLPKGTGLDLQVRGADPGYFSAIQIPFTSGRTFRQDERLARANVVVINNAAAKLCFSNEDPIGRHLKIDFTGETFEIIGVVGDTRWTISQLPEPTLYWPIFGNGYTFATLVLRSSHNVSALAIPVQKLVGQMDPDLPVSNIATLQETIVKSTLGSQFDSILVLTFAIIALILAAAGLYGVLAYLVTQRTPELGIRMTLGAQQTQVLRLVLLDGLRPAILGLFLGLVASAAVVRLVKSMLYETEPLDPVVFFAVSLILILVAATACIIPAWRASRLDPVSSLRAD